MIRVVPFVLAAFAASWLMAEEPKPAPSRLTREQLTAGWINLFDGETLFGWQTVGGSKWNVYKGLLAPEGKEVATIATTMPFDNYELAIEYQTRNDKVELLLRGEIEGNKLSAANGPTLQPTGFGVGTATVRVVSGRMTRMETTISSLGSQGVIMSVAQDSAPTPNNPPPGLIGIRGSGVVIRAVRLRPIDNKPLFNGRNLDGWKIFAGRKGKFTVTPEGHLSVKDGPGDLATEKAYGDFILQLECRTNGKGLNSGIFFRGIPSEYQQGYEAQISNAWLDKPKTIEIETFDPKTHESKGKQKIETLAKDFGTGAIYRRIPARKQLAQDDEWFHLTVVAQGRHLATWVNGIQAVDWIDSRPLNDNPRQGCRLKPGVISIQAHDPTTDLLFKHLRIADRTR